METSESDDSSIFDNYEWEDSLMKDIIEEEEDLNNKLDQKEIEYSYDNDSGFDFQYLEHNIINSIDNMYIDEDNDDDIEIKDIYGTTNIKKRRNNKKKNRRFDRVKNLILKEEEREKKKMIIKKQRYLESIKKKLAPLIENILYITNIPFGTTKDELIQTFSQCTKIVDAGIAKNKHSGFHLGFGFIKVENEEDKQKLLNWEYIPRFRDQFSGKMKAVKLEIANEENTEKFRKLVNCNDKSLNLLSLELDYELQHEINVKRLYNK